MKYLLRVLPYLKPYKPIVAMSLLLTVAISLIGLAMPWPLQILIDNVLGGKPLPHQLEGLLGGLETKTLMIAIVLFGFGLTLAQEGMQVFHNFVNTKIEQKMELDFRSDIFQHVQRLSMAHHDHRRPGAMVYAINFQSGAASRLVMVIPPLAQSLLTLVGMFYILMRIDKEIAFFALAVIPFLYLYIRYYAKNVVSRIREVKRMEMEALSIIHEAMQMFRVIVAFGREPYEFRRFRDQGSKAANARIAVTVRETLFGLAVNTTTAGGTALVLALGASHALDGQITPGQLLVVISYLAAVYRPLETISYTTSDLQELFVNLSIAFNLLDTPPDIDDAPNAVAIDRARGRVTFEDVDFHYAQRQDTLKGISFEAQPGAVVGVVGPTGAGKTTLVSLIPRFYEPSGGRVLIDGRDVKELTLESLRNQISIVLQEPALFSGTIADNIRYGRLDATDDDVFAAAKAANAHDFISALPKAYETEVGERGVQLSGGERQRICVARAFLRDAPIVILDEPTSSVDSRTESVILEALDRLMVGRTTFMIAHRLSTIRHSDMIVVLDHGQIVEQGTHEDLRDKGGLYSQLYAMQAGQREIRPIVAPEEETLIFCPQCGKVMNRWVQGEGVTSYICDNCLAKLELPRLEPAGEDAAD